MTMSGGIEVRSKTYGQSGLGLERRLARGGVSQGQVIAIHRNTISDFTHKQSVDSVQAIDRCEFLQSRRR